MLRFVFATEDLARIRMPTLGPVAEALLSLAALHRPDELLRGGWRRAVLRDQPRWAHPLTEVVGPCCSLDLFTSIGVTGDEEALESIATVSASRLRGELEAAWTWNGPAGRRPAPSAWVQDLPSRREARKRLTTLVDACQRTAISPYWDRMQHQLTAEASRCGRTFAEGGLDQLLRSLHTDIRWECPVLDIGPPGPTITIQLDGRGMDLVPSVFCMNPVAYVDPSAPPIVFYPALRSVADAARTLCSPDAESTDQALTELLGRTRAATLRATAGGCSTTELSRRVGISPAGASQHATVLRKAGLIDTERHGLSVVHDLTPTGRALLDGWAG
jgi:DNA-binding transcriptional ArsR family regulator